MAAAPLTGHSFPCESYTNPPTPDGPPTRSAFALPNNRGEPVDGGGPPKGTTGPLAVTVYPPAGGAAVGGGAPNRNHDDRRPNVLWKLDPLTVTVPPEKTSRIDTTRPPSSPRPVVTTWST